MVRGGAHSVLPDFHHLWLTRARFHCISAVSQMEKRSNEFFSVNRGKAPKRGTSFCSHAFENGLKLFGNECFSSLTMS